MKISGGQMEMVRGDTETLKFYLQKDNELKERIPLVTGDTVTMTVRKTWTDEAKIFQKTVTTFTNGEADIVIEPLDTSSAKFGWHVFDISVTFANGEVKTPIRGEIRIGEEATYGI